MKILYVYLTKICDITIFFFNGGNDNGACELKILTNQDFPGGPAVQNPMPMQGDMQSLVGELGSQGPWGN